MTTEGLIPGSRNSEPVHHTKPWAPRSPSSHRLTTPDPLRRLGAEARGSPEAGRRKPGTGAGRGAQLLQCAPASGAGNLGPGPTCLNRDSLGHAPRSTASQTGTSASPVHVKRLGSRSLIATPTPESSAASLLTLSPRLRNSPQKTHGRAELACWSLLFRAVTEVAAPTPGLPH